MLLWHGCIGTLSPAFSTLQWLGAEHNPRVICCSTHIWPDLLRWPARCWELLTALW